MLTMRPGGWWLPPTRSEGISTGNSYRFLWQAGTVRRLNTTDRLGRIEVEELTEYGAATVFTQRKDTTHLLAVACDAREEDISPPGWRNLSFDHRPVPNTPYTLSYLTVLGNNQQLAAPGPTTQIPQLLPDIYDYETIFDRHGHPTAPNTVHGGLIGRLPLLLALPVFSGPPAFLSAIMQQCVRSKTWNTHPHQYPSGRQFQVYHPPLLS